MTESGEKRGTEQPKGKSVVPEHQSPSVSHQQRSSTLIPAGLGKDCKI